MVVAKLADEKGGSDARPLDLFMEPRHAPNLQSESSAVKPGHLHKSTR
jgi:hypothetical protein